MRALSKSDSTNSLSSFLSDGSDHQEKKIYLIYNENNILVTRNIIQKILKKGGITDKIKDLSIWQRAFTNKSYSKNLKKKRNDKYIYQSDSDVNTDEVIPIQKKSNETLEYLGDAMIQSIIGHYLYKRFKKQDEGFLTKNRSKLVKTETLAKLGFALGLDKYILISKHQEEMCNGRKSSKIIEDTFESFIGAMMEDFSKLGEAYAYDICRKFVINIMESEIDIIEIIRKDDNYKDQLMRYFQKTFSGKFPKYNLEDINTITNPNGTIIRKFIMSVADINGNIIGKGEGRSKKGAEQKAAKAALLHFGLINGF